MFGKFGFPTKCDDCYKPAIHHFSISAIKAGEEDRIAVFHVCEEHKEEVMRQARMGAKRVDAPFIEFGEDIN